MKSYMKVLFIVMTMAVISNSLLAEGSDNITVIPRPQQIEMQDGAFSLSSKTVIVAQGKAVAEAQKLADVLRPATGFALPVKSKASRASASIQIQLLDDKTTATLGDEGYLLQVEPEKVVITANTNAGLFYGAQTLRQLLPTEIFSETKQKGIAWKIPCVEITDKPRFKWRGMMLDVSRHFFDADYVKRYIDFLAIHKINVFHWHLTDDDGWRIEIKKYPKLTEIGAWRGPDEVLPASRSHLDQRYGGFYTQEQIRDIVAYAAARHVNIMPEIDVPGHALAITGAYPETLPSVVGESKSVQGVKANAISPAREENYKMLDDIFGEVAALFPFKYIHVGGDEVNHKIWKDCPQIKSLMQREGLRNLSQVQNYFTRRLETIIRGHGRQMMGWNEILGGGNLQTETAVMSWIGTGPGIQAAKRGHPVVMTPGPFTYFDMKYPGPDERGHWWAGLVSTEKTYSFDPLGFTELNAEQSSRIFGVQACLWTEFVETPLRAEYQTYPRLCALSEVGWTDQDKRQWEDFQQRMGSHLQRLEAKALQFRVPSPAARVKEGLVTITPAYPGMEITYITDGTEPTRDSKRYTAPFKCSDTDQLRCRAFSGPRPGKIVAGAEKEPFAQWTPDKVSTEFQTLTVDATDEIRSAGTWKLEFRYKKGKHRLVMRSAALLENGRQIARDEHDGHAGGSHQRNIYSLPMKTYKPDATYKIVAEVRSDGGSDSYGNLILERSVWLEPAAMAETNISHYGSHNVQNLTDWSRDSFFWSNRPVKKGEYILLSLAEPVECSFIESRTGKLDNANADLLTDGVLEISADGKTFQQVAEFAYGTAKAEFSKKKIKAIRIRVTADGADQWLVVQNIRLK